MNRADSIREAYFKKQAQQAQQYGVIDKEYFPTVDDKAMYYDIDSVGFMMREVNGYCTIVKKEECKLMTGNIGGMVGTCAVQAYRKTVLVKFVNGYSTNKSYAFNLRSNYKSTIDLVSIGTIISSCKYDNDMIVVGILEYSYNYVNKANGDLKKNFNNTNDMELVEINLDELKQIVSFVKARAK